MTRNLDASSFVHSRVMHRLQRSKSVRGTSTEVLTIARRSFASVCVSGISAFRKPEKLSSRERWPNAQVSQTQELSLQHSEWELPTLRRKNTFFEQQEDLSQESKSWIIIPSNRSIEGSPESDTPSLRAAIDDGGNQNRYLQIGSLAMETTSRETIADSVQYVHRQQSILLSIIPSGLNIRTTIRMRTASS